MQATNQEDTAEIAVTKTKYIQQPEASAFGGKIFFKHKIATLVPRIVSGVKINLNSKNWYRPLPYR